jgi:hypothetical protein
VHEPVSLGVDGRIAAGTTATFRTPFGSNSLDGVELTSSASSTITARVINSYELEVTAHAAGSATLEARVLAPCSIRSRSPPCRSRRSRCSSAPRQRADHPVRGVRGASDDVPAISRRGREIPAGGQFAASNDVIVR